MKNFLLFLFLILVYLSLAYKNPFKTNNLISNLEPPPDVFYYSVPAWNLVHGKGFKMEAFGVEISKLSTPLYGIFLSPFFLIFDDVRSYYYANLFLGFLSIFLFLILIDIFLGKNKLFIKFVLGIILVTNFYFYNLSTLLMAENILIPLTLMAVILMLQKLDFKNFVLTLLVIVLLVFAKVSALPIVFILGVFSIFKFFKYGFIKKIPKKWLPIIGIVFVILMILAFLRIVLPGIKALPKASGNFSPIYIEKTLPIYLKELVGGKTKYLWYDNNQLEILVSIVSIIGLCWGLFLRKFRKKVLSVVLIIFGVILFHSMMSYPEGRYVSTVIPLFLVLSAVVFEELKFWFWPILFLFFYLFLRVNINGFYERKATSLKRQILNNQLEENEIPWNFIAVNRVNNYFSNKKDVYLGTLINPFYIMYFGNKNYNFLPLSAHQEFSGPGKGFIDKMLEKDGSVIGLYKRLLGEGNEVYVTNYYLTYYKGSVDSEYYGLEKIFKFTQVDEGCLGECKIYKLDLLK